MVAISAPPNIWNNGHHKDTRNDEKYTNLGRVDNRGTDFINQNVSDIFQRFRGIVSQCQTRIMLLVYRLHMHYTMYYVEINIPIFVEFTKWSTKGGGQKHCCWNQDMVNCWFLKFRLSLIWTAEISEKNYLPSLDFLIV